MKNKLLLRTNIILCVILLAGFVSASVVIYQSNIGEYREYVERIASLTSDGIYYQGRSYIDERVNTSLAMANDVLLKRFLMEETDEPGEAFRGQIQEYLNTYKEQYGYLSAFLVSAKTDRYYHYSGQHRTLVRGAPENEWFYGLLESAEDYSFDAGKDQYIGEMYFIDAKIYDGGEVMGVIGVGFQIDDYLQAFMQRYHDEYDIAVMLIGSDNADKISNEEYAARFGEFKYMDRALLEAVIEETGEGHVTLWGSGQRRDCYTVARYIPGLKCYLIVENDLSALRAPFERQFALGVCAAALIALSILFALNKVLSSYNKKLLALAVSQEAASQIEHLNRLLKTVNRISVILLQSDAESFERNLLSSMGVMAEAVQADRVYIWENFINDGELYCYQIYEWSEGAEPQQGKPLLQGVSYRDVLPSWEKAFLRKQCINGIVKFLPKTEYALLNEQGILSLIVVPIFLKEQFWGFVGFDDCHSERVFSADEESILRSASELIANALIRNHLETEIDKIYYDPLTGIYNRRYFDENMERIFPQLTRSGSMVSVMIVDIDFFKRYNDTYGHGEGDACLITVANTLENSITRADDFVVRFGGEEFAVVLPNTDEAGARLIAEKMLNNVRGCNIPHAKNDAADCVTVSIGVVTSRAEYTDNVEAYLKRADEMLYQAKNDGRNRYSFANLLRNGR